MYCTKSQLGHCCCGTPTFSKATAPCNNIARATVDLHKKEKNKSTAAPQPVNLRICNLVGNPEEESSILVVGWLVFGVLHVPTLKN